jgi:sporulation protein YlmC with PRC-barrel domain
MKKHWSQIAKLPAKLDPDSNELGRINGVFIHPDNGQIIGFLVGIMKVLVPVDIRKWTTKHVLITEHDALMAPMDIYRLKESGLRRAFFNGKRVQSKSGRSYGMVRDFRIDLTHNQLITFEVSKRFLGIEWAQRQFQFRDIDHISDSKVIMVFEPEDAQKITIKNPIPTT